MEAEFSHLPVMAREVVELLLPVPAGLIVDCTVGGGGHSALLLEARPDVRLLGIDRDADAVAAARSRLARFGDRAAGGARRIRAARRAGRTPRRGGTSHGHPDGSRGEQPAARPARARLLVPVRRAARHAHGRQAGADRGRRRQRLRRGTARRPSSRSTAKSGSRAASRTRSSRPARCASTRELADVVRDAIPGRDAPPRAASRRAAPSRRSAWRSTASSRTSPTGSTSRCT